MDKPTLSPQSNRLLEMCEGVLEGKVNPEKLWGLLEKMYQGLEKARNDFVEQVQKQGADYAEKMQLEMDMVLASFEDFQEGLDQISEYFRTEDPADIQDGMEIIIRATNEILDTLTVYESKSLQIGPTSFPILNMIILLIDGFKDNTVTEKEFRFMINNAGQFFQKLVDEAEGYEGEGGRQAIKVLGEGYNKFLDGLEMMDEAAQTKNFGLFDKALEIVKDSQEIIRKGYDQFNDDMFMNGPTDSPITNLLISTINSVKDGTVPEDLLSENLEKYQDHIDSMRIDMEGATFIPLEDKQVKEEVDHTLEALDLADDACDLIAMFLQNGNESLLGQAVERLKESTLMLKESLKVFDEASEREGKIACVRCGALNEPTNNSCVKCNAVLTKIPGQESSTFAVGEGGEIGPGYQDEFVMTENLYKLLQAVEQFINGRIGYKEFNKTLSWMERLLEETLDEAEKIPPVNVEGFPPEKREEAQRQQVVRDEALDLLKDGIEDFLDAIEEMRQAGIDGDMAHIRDGIDAVIESAKKLQKVEKMGDKAENSISSLEGGGTDFAKEQGVYNYELDQDNDAFISSTGGY